jgi:hypothetical protein
MGRPSARLYSIVETKPNHLSDFHDIYYGNSLQAVVGKPRVSWESADKGIYAFLPVISVFLDSLWRNYLQEICT